MHDHTQHPEPTHTTSLGESEAAHHHHSIVCMRVATKGMSCNWFTTTLSKIGSALYQRTHPSTLNMLLVFLCFVPEHSAPPSDRTLTIHSLSAHPTNLSTSIDTKLSTVQYIDIHDD